MRRSFRDSWTVCVERCTAAPRRASAAWDPFRQVRTGRRVRLHCLRGLAAIGPSNGNPELLLSTEGGVECVSRLPLLVVA